MRIVYCRGLCTTLGLLSILFFHPTPPTGGEAASDSSRYTVTLLPLEEANAINNRGQIAGQSRGHAALWQNGKVRDLGVLPLPRSQSSNQPVQSTATALNDRGEVAGNSGLFLTYPGDIGGGFDSRPFLWAQGRMRPLGTLGGDYGEAKALNDAGAVVGQADRSPARDPSDGVYRSRTLAFLWRRGRMHSLRTLGGADSVALGMNHQAQVVGWSVLRPRFRETSEQFIMRAFIWEKGRMRDLGTLPGFESSSATAINNHGQAVGELYRTYTEYRTTSHAFLWEKGRMRDLGAPAGCSSTALAINDRGQVVGFAQSRSVDTRALLWEGGRIDDLNTLLPPATGWILSEARGINNQGQIVGVGTWKGKQRGFLLTPGK